LMAARAASKTQACRLLSLLVVLRPALLK